jgi:hypothetical protein
VAILNRVIKSVAFDFMMTKQDRESENKAESEEGGKEICAVILCRQNISK